MRRRKVCRHVGAAHVRPATFPQVGVCLTRAGRACPAPTTVLAILSALLYNETINNQEGTP